MKVFRLLIISIIYLLIGVLEAYSYYMFKIDAIGILFSSLLFVLL